MKVAIVNQVGFERGGATTLCLQYKKLGFDVFFKDSVNSKLAPSENYYTSKTVLSTFSKYDRILFLNLWYGKEIPVTVLDDILLLHKTYPHIELCYLHCWRKVDNLAKLLIACEQAGFMFTHIFSISPLIKKFNLNNFTIMNINAFTPISTGVFNKEVNNIVFSSGRVEAVKGTTKYLTAIDNKFLLNSNFTFIHEGANFTITKKGTISCPPQIMSVFDVTKDKGKILKSFYAFKQYGETPEIHKFNIYPVYDIDTAYYRWQKCFAGICCILGTKSKHYIENTLFGESVFVTDSREQKAIDEGRCFWNTALEYADIEKIMVGIPVLFSFDYAKIIGFSDTRLIYDCFAEIPDKLNNLLNCRDEVRNAQYDWFINTTNNVNNEVITQFTKEFT